MLVNTDFIVKILTCTITSDIMYDSFVAVVNSEKQPQIAANLAVILRHKQDKEEDVWTCIPEDNYMKGNQFNSSQVGLTVYFIIRCLGAWV